LVVIFQVTQIGCEAIIVGYKILKFRVSVAPLDYPPIEETNQVLFGLKPIIDISDEFLGRLDLLEPHVIVLVDNLHRLIGVMSVQSAVRVLAHLAVILAGSGAPGFFAQVLAGLAVSLRTRLALR
jgi:hypothetical protein